MRHDHIMVRSLSCFHSSSSLYIRRHTQEAPTNKAENPWMEPCNSLLLLSKATNCQDADARTLRHSYVPSHMTVVQWCEQLQFTKA